MRVAITGVSGYLGRLLAPRLAADGRVTELTGLDLVAPSVVVPGLRFASGDILGPELDRTLGGSEVAVHLAFVVQELRDKQRTRRVNVEGTRAFFRACERAGVRRIVLASSIAAYGQAAGQPLLLEDSPLLGSRRSYYAETKRIVDEMAGGFSRAHPEVTVTRLRPSILCGPRAVGFVAELLESPVYPYVLGNEAGLPFVHEDDVIRALHQVVVEPHPGPFNLDAGNLPPRRAAALLGVRPVGLPYLAARALADVGFAAGLLPFSSHWVELARAPFRVSTHRAQTLLGWRPTRSAEEAFAEMVEQHRSAGATRRRFWRAR